MFDNRKSNSRIWKQLRRLHRTMQELSPESLLASLGDWTPRDIAAHFIGWNRITLAGCSALREGAEPFYFYDGTNDYRKVNAKFFVQFPSTDRDELLKEMLQRRMCWLRI